MSEFLDYQAYIYAAYAIVLVTLCLWLALRHRGKMRVYIKDPLGDKIEWHKPQTDEKGNFIVMRKAKGKGFGWLFHFDNRHVQYGHGRFGKYQYVEIFPESPEAIAFDYGGRDVEQHHWDKKTNEEYVNRKLLERRGEEPKEQKSDIVLWIIAGLVIVNVIMTVVLSGRIRIG